MAARKYRGVTYDKRYKKYRAYVSVGGKVRYVGSANKAKDAALMYNSAAILWLGDDAKLNIVDGSTKSEEYDPRRQKKKDGYRGVSFHIRRGKWMAHITVDYKKTFLGYFESQELAALARDRAARKMLGDKCLLNFPSVVDYPDLP